MVREPQEERDGINAGEFIEEDGDLFGATVILASRSQLAALSSLVEDAARLRAASLSCCRAAALCRTLQVNVHVVRFGDALEFEALVRRDHVLIGDLRAELFRRVINLCGSVG